MSGDLLHPPEEIIQQMLVDMGEGVIGGQAGDWPIFAGDFPGNDEETVEDDAVAIYGTQGLIQGRSHIDGEMAEKYGIQVRVRAENVVDGYVKCKSVFDKLTKQVLRREVDVDLEVYVVQAVTSTSTVIPLGRTGPDRNRHYVANFVASISMVASAGTGS